MATTNRECTVCGLTKPLEEYPRTKNYVKRTCKKCYNKTKNLYRQSSPESYLYSRLNNSNKHRPPSNLTKQDLKDMWDGQQGKCSVTGMHMTYAPRRMKNSTGLNASIDRIDQSKGYEKGNVRLVCYRVNLMRHAGEDVDLLWWCKQIIEGIEGE